MSKRLSASCVAVVAAIAGMIPAGAVPPALVGVLASPNVDFVAALPDVAATGARFRGDLMYVTSASGLQIFKIGSDGIPLPQGALALPHYENEDVDTNGKTLLIAADHFLGEPTMLYVIDVSNPMTPLPLNALRVSDAHTVSCINNCSYAWLAGSTRVYVVDLRDPANPKEIGGFDLPVRGSSHDVQVDEAGIAWVSAGGGLFGYTTADPLRPTLVASRPNGTSSSFNNDFIIHNSWRPNAKAWRARTTDDGTVRAGELVLVTEEDWLVTDNKGCSEDGRFQTGRYAKIGSTVKLTKLDDFHIGQGTAGDLSELPRAAVCSSHYFSYRPDGIVAVAWYQQGTRFLDVSNPKNIRQIGYYLPPVGESFATYYYKGMFYVLDTVRGIEILKLTNGAGAPTQLAPHLNLAAPLGAPHPDFGYACRLPVVA